LTIPPESERDLNENPGREAAAVHGRRWHVNPTAMAVTRPEDVRMTMPTVWSPSLPDGGAALLADGLRAVERGARIIS
jgi:hypothetical protein